MISSILNRTEPSAMPSTQFKQLVGDLSNAIKSSYEKNAQSFTGGKMGAGIGGASFLDELGLSGLAKSYKEKAEAKETKRQAKADFVGNFQKYSDAGQNLSADTSRSVAESLFEEIDAKLQELKKLEDEANTRKEAGFGTDPNNQEQQNKLIEEIKKLQPNSPEQKEAEKNNPEKLAQKEAEKNNPDKAIGAVTDEETKTEAAATLEKQYEVTVKTSDDLIHLFVISDDYFKKMIDRTDKMVNSLKVLEDKDFGGSGGGEGGADFVSGAADLLGNKGGKVSGKGAGKLGRVGKGLSMLGKVAGPAAGILAVGTAAYEGYSEYQDAADKVQSGELTQKEGQVEKTKAVTGAVGGAAGGAGGAWGGGLAGAAIGTMILPGIGTVVGGALGAGIGGLAGYFGGKAAGKAVGEAGAKGYQSLSSEETPPSAMDDPNAKIARDWAWSIMTNQAGEKKPADSIKDRVESIIKNDTELKKQAEKFLAEKRGMQSAQQASPSLSGTELKSANTQLENTRDAASAAAGATTNVVNAPVTNVSNTNNNGDGKKPAATKNEDSTFNRYMDRRYYPSPAR
jgi:hypothetical protein